MLLTTATDKGGFFYATIVEKTTTGERAIKKEKTRPVERASYFEKTKTGERAKQVEKTTRAERASYSEKTRKERAYIIREGRIAKGKTTPME